MEIQGSVLERLSPCSAATGGSNILRTAITVSAKNSSSLLPQDITTVQCINSSPTVVPATSPDIQGSGRGKRDWLRYLDSSCHFWPRRATHSRRVFVSGLGVELHTELDILMLLHITSQAHFKTASMKYAGRYSGKSGSYCNQIWGKVFDLFSAQ